MPLAITHKLTIPDSELRFTSTRSSGPGGQHVNKVNSRVILEFDVWHSSALTSEQKRTIAEKLASRLNQQGVLRLQSQRHRTQSANRSELSVRFAELLNEALRHAKKRIPTRIPPRIREERLTEKKFRTRLKQGRQRPKTFDES